MHDTHCHVDLYEDPERIALEIERKKIFTIAVTNLPTAYYEAVPHVKRFPHLHLGVGLHPLLAIHHTPHQKKLFERAFSETSFIGEIGLDYSREGISTKEIQLSSFRFVLKLLADQKKVVTLHSRRAERDVLALLEEYKVGPVIFHWYTGSISLIDKIIAAAHYLSINSSMLTTKSGQAIVRAIPQEQVLTETDGPFTKIATKPTIPSDVRHIHSYLAALWELSVESVDNILEDNLQRLLHTTHGF